MAVELLNHRNRTVSAVGALAANALLVAALLSLSTGAPPPSSRPGLVSFNVAEPRPPAPPPHRKPAGAAPPSRGATHAPSLPRPPHPLPSPTPAQPAVDAGSQSASGAGAAAGSGAGQGGQGNGTGAGGAGPGSGAVTPPVHIAGALTNADYARTSHPRGAAGTVTISFRVRSDGAVDRCRVTGSSGYPSIDEATCRLVEQRFRFRPALDASGNPVDFSLRTNFTWEPR